MSSSYSTITSNVNLLLVNSSTITNFAPYVAYVSSVSIPGRIATVRDAVGLVSSPGRLIILSTLKGVLFSDGTSSITISQPYGYVTLSSRDKNTWDIINTFAFPQPSPVSYVSSVYASASINANSIVARSYISTTNLTVDSISSINIRASTISTGVLLANTISTNNLQVNRSLIVPTGFISTLSTNFAYISFVSTANILVNSLSSLNIQANSISTNSITTNSISTVNILTNSISTTNLTASTISTNMLFATNVSSIRFQAVNILTSSITVTGISTNNILTNSISTNNLFASNVSTNFLLASLVSTNNILTNSISTNNILVNSISTNNLQANTISTNILFAPSISTNNLLASFIQTTNISSININTNNISTNNISTNYLFASNISTINLRASTISTSLLFSRFVSSLQMQTSSIVLKSGTSPGYLYTSDDGQTLYLNSNSVGTWVSNATSDLNMCNYNITNITSASLLGTLTVNGKSFLGGDLSGANADLINLNIIDTLTLHGYNINLNPFGPFSIYPPINYDISGQRLLNVQQTQTITDGATNIIIPQTIINSNVTTNNITLAPTFTTIRTIQTFNFNATYFSKFSVCVNFKGNTNNNSNTGTIYLYATLSNVNTSQEITGNTFTSSYPYEYTQSGIQPTRIRLSYTDIFDITGYSSWSTGNTIDLRIYMCTNNTNFVGSYFNTVNTSVTIQPIIYNS